MSKFEKAVLRLQSKPKDYRYHDLEYLLKQLGFIEVKTGKTSGSRTSFLKDNISIKVHKPHPKPIIKSYVIDQLIDVLEENKLI